MKKENRLHSERDFKLLFGQGKRTDTRLFRMIMRPNGLARSRFAFIAPRSAEKRAVWRNRARRRASEWIRRNQELFREPMDVALMFKKEAMASPRKIFYEELRKAFARALGG